MKCPICGKDVELQKKQIGTSENGDPIFNEYAICRDCKKQWNLDKQRAKKMAAKKAAEQAAKAVSEKPAAPVKPAEPKAAAPQKKAEPGTAPKAAPKKHHEERPSDSAGKPVKKRPVREHDGEAASVSGEKAEGRRRPSGERPEGRRRPSGEKPKRPAEHPGKSRTEAPDEHTAKKPVKKRPVRREEAEEEQKYGNIPSEKVRAKHEKAARKGYEEMLAADPEKKPVKKKKAVADKTKEVEDISAVKKLKKKDEEETSRKKPAAKAEEEVSRKKPKTKVEEYDDYDDDDYDDYDEYDEAAPRFRAFRIILGILSLAGFLFFIYRGFVTGLSSVSSGDGSTAGMTYIIIALCMLVSALLYLIMQKKNTIFAFLLPMLFYLASAVFAFLRRGDDLQILIGAVAGAVLAVISLILAIASRGGDDYEDDEDDYEDPFEEDHDNY